MERPSQEAVDLYDRYTHSDRRDPGCSGGASDPPMERRDFFSRMTLLAGSAVLAEGWIAAIAASPAAAAITPADDKRLITRKGGLVEGNALQGYVAVKKGTKKAPVVIVIHENRGLNAHIEDVARRIALEGFVAVAPDMLTPSGGTPTDENDARTAIGQLDLNAAVASVVKLIGGLKALDGANGKVGAVGFCWGGAFIDRLAVAAGAALDAGVSYYGPAPAPAEAAKVKAPLLLHFAALDTRVAATGKPWVAALKAAGKSVSAYEYPGVNHAFNNDTSAERYNKAAADLAWKRTVEFFRKNLG